MSNEQRAAIKHRGTELDGLYFPSGVEAVGWLLAQELVKRGHYDKAERQTKMPLLADHSIEVVTPTGKPMIYRPDLLLWRGTDCRMIDVKGRMDSSQAALYHLKTQLIKATYGVQVETWRAADIKRVASEHGIDIRAIARGAGVEWAMWAEKKGAAA